ncbi:profilin-3-like [Haliotis asinina]|uniref:profilin-3-like n=1 Tax=Haliotis asinina TaxID=109174 RepID=UPI003531FCF0
MTWNEIVDSLISEGKLKKAAIFDLNGEKLAGTSGINITRQEAVGILKSMVFLTTNIFSLFVEAIQYSCFAVDKDTVIGRNSDGIFVAQRSKDVLICGFTDVTSEVSCLGGVRNFATKLTDQVGPVVAAPSLM